MQSVRNEEKTKELSQNFARSYLGIDWHDLVQISYVDLPSCICGANLVKWSQSYIGVKITFFIFL